MYDAFLKYTRTTDRNTQLIVFLAVALVLLWIATAVVRLLINLILRLVTRAAAKSFITVQVGKINRCDSKLVKETDPERRNQLIREGNMLAEQISARLEKVWTPRPLKVLTIIRNILSAALIVIAVLVWMKVNPDIVKKVNDIYLIVEKWLLNLLKLIQPGTRR